MTTERAMRASFRGGRPPSADEQTSTFDLTHAQQGVNRTQHVFQGDQAGAKRFLVPSFDRGAGRTVRDLVGLIGARRPSTTSVDSVPDALVIRIHYSTTPILDQTARDLARVLCTARQPREIYRLPERTIT
jgi:hypothetical protein